MGRGGCSKTVVAAVLLPHAVLTGNQVAFTSAGRKMCSFGMTFAVGPSPTWRRSSCVSARPLPGSRHVLAQLFTSPQGYWAVFSAIIIMQASVGGSVKATINRVIGTIGGAVAGSIAEGE
jgi:hypothetical protein